MRVTNDSRYFMIYVVGEYRLNKNGHVAFFGATPVSIPHHTASLEVETVFGPGTSEFESKHYAFLSHCLSDLVLRVPIW